MFRFNSTPSSDVDNDKSEHIPDSAGLPMDGIQNNNEDLEDMDIDLYYS